MGTTPAPLGGRDVGNEAGVPGSREADRGEVRLRLQRRQQGPQGPPRRQGCEPRRDDQAGASRATWVHHHHGDLPAELRVEVTMALRRLEDTLGRTLGDFKDPLLVSVRSRAKFSMPGMMETVLNIGLTDASVQGLAEFSGDPRFAWDSYRRLIQMFGKTVLDIDGDDFAHVLDEKKKARGATADTELTAEDLIEVVTRFKEIIFEQSGREFPQHPREQLDLAIAAVFNSWNTDRARLYRRRERISNDLGTAVNVVSMVFGNLGTDSGTGVCFTRDPSTGMVGVYGDYLANAQGEDVVWVRSFV